MKKTTLDLFRKWGVGRKGVNDGIVLMLAVRNRQARITVEYGLERILTTPILAPILVKMRPDLGSGAYAAALNLALDEFEKLLPPGGRDNH